MCQLSTTREKPGRWRQASLLTLGVCLLAAVAAHGAAPLAGPHRLTRPPAEPVVSDALVASPEPGWPQWRGPRRDGISRQRGLRATWPENGPPLLWRVEGLGTGWSSPIVVGQRLYVTGDVDDQLVVFAFDVAGNRLWQAVNGKSWTGSYPGARASCTYSAGNLYHLNAHGRLACLAAATGGERWSVEILERFRAENTTWALSESVLVDGPRVIVTPGGKAALAAALDKQDGRTVWTSPPLEEDQASHASPILFRWQGRRVIANCSSAHGSGLAADDGQLLWTVPLKNRFGVNASSPVYGSGRLFFVTPYAEEGRQYRLSATGPGWAAQQVWQSSLDTVTGGALLVEGTLYAAGYKKSKWWFAVDWQTGATKQECKELSTGAAVYADGRLYCLDERGTVGLLEPGASSLEIAGRFRLPLDDRTRDAWAHPVVCDGRLYLRYHDTLWCYDVMCEE